MNILAANYKGQMFNSIIPSVSSEEVMAEITIRNIDRSTFSPKTSIMFCLGQLPARQQITDFGVLDIGRCHVNTLQMCRLQ